MRKSKNRKAAKSYSRLKIQDEFTHLNISRQRKYQLRRKRDGLCTICGKPVLPGTLMCFKDHKKRGSRRPGSRKRQYQ